MNSSKKQLRRYKEDEENCLLAHIVKYFGRPEQLLKDNDKEMAVDIYVIEPTEDSDYYTLVTMGMGGYKMDMQDYERAELLIMLPKSWDITNELWPFRWLKVLAKLPMKENEFAGYGTAVGNEEAFANNTKLSGFVWAMPAASIAEEGRKCVLPNTNVINYYQVFPVYEEELLFREEHGTEELFKLFGDNFSLVTDIDRKNYCL